MDIPASARLVKLSDSNLALARPSQDLRGRTVVDANGEEVGEVDDLLIDEAEKQVRFLRVASGGFFGMGAAKFLLPVDAVTEVKADQVRISRSRDRVAEAPAYDPDLIDPVHLGDVYNHYGYTPYWTPGYVYPFYPYYV